MSTLVEMIEALQKEWRERIAFREKRAYRLDDSVTDRLRTCADALAPILAAAREQASELHLNIRALEHRTQELMSVKQELAAMKEPLECGHPKAFWKDNSGAFIPGLSSQLHPHGYCSLCADLREIAEMARLSCKNIIINQCREHGNWKKDGAPSKILRAEASDLIDGLSPASIVREFREKKAKVRK